MPLVGLYLVNKVSSSFIHVYISKRQCMRDTGSDECQILLLLYCYQHVVFYMQDKTAIYILCFKANLCYMLKEFSILLKIYTGTLIAPPSFDTVHHFLNQITNFAVTHYICEYSCPSWAYIW
jgi:hypothetical protein